MPINSNDPPKWRENEYVTVPQNTWTFRDSQITWAVVERANYACRYNSAYWDESSNTGEDAGYWDNEDDAKAACEALVLLHRE